MPRLLIPLLVLVSGFAGLVYEVLWMKQLGLLFGNTSHAAAATLAAFFAGLAAGSWFWGKRSAKAQNPLRTYAWLQLGIAVTALFYFAVLACYYAVYPGVYQAVNSRAGLLLIKFALALVLVFPPAFCMGGTIPVLGQHLIRRRSAFGTTSALLYGLNTLGAAAGALLAGFYFPLWLGFRLTCFGAVSLSTLVAVTAFLLSRKAVPVGGGLADDGENAVGAACRVPQGPAPRDQGTAPVTVKHARRKKTRRKRAAARADNRGGSGPERRGTADEADGRTEVMRPSPGWAAMLVCFLSGFGVLALEVLWTRMFAQVLENSVYTFATILVIVLICLSVGALISSGLARLRISPIHLLAILMLIGATAVTLMPFVFMRLTNSLQILVSTGSWSDYVLMIFKNGFIAIGPPALLLGTIFPYLMKVEERSAVSAGLSLGRLAAINTVGAILGSLLAGFVLLEWLGMWRSVQVIALLYPYVLLVLPTGWRNWGLAVKVPAVLLIVLLFTVLNPSALPITSVDSMRHQEEIVETWEGSDCTVAVVRDRYGVAIKINSHYSLGSTGAFMQEKLQADLPLMIWPETASIFFLGMGTGITAGSALDPQFENVKKVVACEIVPEVVAAARKYMTNLNGFDATGGLFTDPRASILIEDGRHFLMAAKEQFDMINADLFVPFRSGAGNLYTREHFRSVRKRLKPGGIFVQWVPLYQVTENEFCIIARTMLEEFDQVSLWRNNFQPGDEVVAFMGHTDLAPLPASEIDSRTDKLAAVEGKTYFDLRNLALPFNPKTILLFYCGNLTVARELFEDFPVNRDDKPLIEYMAPRTYRRKTDSPLPWFIGPRIATWVEKVQEICPPDADPLLVNRTAANRRLPVAGTAFHRARIFQVIGDEHACREAWQDFFKEWTGQ